MAKPGPWDLSGEATHLSDLIRKQSRNAARRQKKKKERSRPNPLDQLMQQIQSIDVPETPFDQLLGQARSTASAQFDPLITELQGEMQRTKKRGRANQKEAHAMYNALASDIAAELPAITDQMARASKETQRMYDEAQAELKNQYDKQAEEQAALYKKLGIQAATPEATQQARDDQAYFQNQSTLDEKQSLQLLKEMKNSDVSYNRQSADNTRLAGNNIASDIGAQLEEYLQTAGTKLSGLKASKESAIQAMLSQLQQQDAERVQKAESQEYDRLMDMFNLQLKMQDMQSKAAARAAKNNGSLFKGTNGPTGAANYLAEIYGSGDTFTPDKIMEAINDVMGSKDMVAGKYQSDELKDSYGKGAMLRATPEYAVDLLRKRLKGGNAPLSAAQFSNYDINNAINALMAYMGKLK